MLDRANSKLRAQIKVGNNHKKEEEEKALIFKNKRLLYNKLYERTLIADVLLAILYTNRAFLYNR